MFELRDMGVCHICGEWLSGGQCTNPNCECHNAVPAMPVRRAKNGRPLEPVLTRAKNGRPLNGGAR